MAEAREPRPQREIDLEARIQRLESAFAERPAANDEDELANRVITRLSALAAERDQYGDGVLVLASRAEAPPAPPQGAVLHPPATAVEPTSRTWFLAHVVAELRLVLTMYFDPRYRISRTAQFALPGIVLVIIFNYFFFSVWVNITFLSPVVERLLIVILAVLGYKLLVREIARYREVLAYLARYGR